MSEGASEPMAKRSHPALYEVIRTKGPLVPIRSDRPEAGPAAPPPPPVSAPAMLTPGHLVRIPVGYVWISIGAVVAACVLSYVIGHSAGRSIANLERGDRLRDSVAAAERGGDGISDPLRNGGTGLTPSTPQANAPGTGLARGSQSSPSSDRAVGGDPRQRGWHYYVLVHGTEEGAVRMADFFTAEGVDARVVPDNNGRLRKVIALPGLADRAEQSSPAAERLRDSLEATFRKWRQATGDRSRRSPEYYLEPFVPPSR